MCTNHGKVCYAGSRFTTYAESRYTPIEGEALVVLFALESCHVCLRIRREWIEFADRREMAHENRKQQVDSYSPGATVSIQNQRGNHPRRKNATETVIDCLPHRQYKVVVEGSLVTLRNRRFHRQIRDITRNTLDDGEH